MGFFGDFVLARSDSPLLALPLFGDGARCDEGHADCLHMCWPRPGGWQTLQAHHGLPDNDDDHWLQDLVTATRSPVMVASVMDSDLCYVRGLAPSGASWSAFLDPVMTAAYEIPAPAPACDEAPPGETEQARAIRWMRTAAPATAQEITLWATEAGFTADHEAVLTALTRRADPFAEDLFFELVDACGLPASMPDQEPPAGMDTPAHPGHRPNAHCPRGEKLETAVLNLRRNGHLVLECAAEPDCYVQVWLRPDGTYQLEYRDLNPAEHYQTRALSAEKVVTALTAWRDGEIAWRENFQWNAIGSQFGEPPSLPTNETQTA